MLEPVRVLFFFLFQARRYKDFISLLPGHIALKILDYLSVQDLLQCCKVRDCWGKNTPQPGMIYEKKNCKIGVLVQYS